MKKSDKQINQKEIEQARAHTHTQSEIVNCCWNVCVFARARASAFILSFCVFSFISFLR